MSTCYGEWISLSQLSLSAVGLRSGDVLRLLEREFRAPTWGLEDSFSPVKVTLDTHLLSVTPGETSGRLTVYVCGEVHGELVSSISRFPARDTWTPLTNDTHHSDLRSIQW